MGSSNVSAVLFVKELKRVAEFYIQALGMNCSFNDDHHCVLNCSGFELIVHQIPKPIADHVIIQSPPRRRVEGAIRLNFPVRSIEQTRRIARSLGGELDDAPPPWAAPDSNIFLGYDPDGNVFAASEHAETLSEARP